MPNWPAATRTEQANDNTLRSGNLRFETEERHDACRPGRNTPLGVDLTSDKQAQFDLGLCEVSCLAKEALLNIGVDPASLFVRHQHGDWGAAPDWRARCNDRCVRNGRDSHVIVSRYVLQDETEVVLVTSMMRTRTRLQLAEEHRTLEVSSAEGYAIWADEYDAGSYLAQYEETFVLPMMDRIGSVKSVVDVGTGTGRYALGFADAGARVVGVDESMAMLSVASSKSWSNCQGRVGWVQAELGSAHLPLCSDAFDLLVCALVLSHVGDLRAAVQDCVRVVRPGGSLILTAFHPVAVQWYGGGAGFQTPDAEYRLPAVRHTREDYLEAVQLSRCEVREVHDIASGGTEYGDISELAVKERGQPPRCLVILAAKPNGTRVRTGGAL